MRQASWRSANVTMLLLLTTGRLSARSINVGTEPTAPFTTIQAARCRRRKLYEQLRQRLGEVFRQLALQKDSKILEGHLAVDRRSERPR